MKLKIAFYQGESIARAVVASFVRRLGIACLFVLVQACSTLPRSAVPPESGQAMLADSTAQLTYRAVNKDELYRLLVAEVAIQRGHYDAALNVYKMLSYQVDDPQVVARALKLAQLREDRELALRLARHWLNISGGSSQARAVYGAELLNHGAFFEALRQADLLFKSGHEVRLVTIVARALELSEQRWEAFRDSYQALFKDHMRNAQVRLGWALVQQRDNQLQEAGKLVRLALKQEPDNLDALRLDAELTGLLEGPEAGIDKLRMLVGRYPQDANFREQLGRLLAISGQLPEALKQFRNLGFLQPYNPLWALMQALLHWEIGGQAKAVEIFQMLLENRAYEDTAHYYLGVWAESHQFLDDALVHYQNISAGRYLASGAEKASQLMARMGHLDKAINYLKALSRLYPSADAAFSRVLGELLIKYDQTDQALALMNEALLRHPQDLRLLYTRSVVSEKRGDLPGLEADLRAMLALDSDNATALNALGYTLANRTNRYDEALELISRALKLEPLNPAIIDSMGWVLYRLGESKKALEYLRRALELQSDPEIAAHLIEVLWISGNRAEARRVFDRSAALFPDAPLLKHVMRRFSIGQKKSRMIEGDKTAIGADS